MPQTRIHQSLANLFTRHRLVFWYDATGEWKKEYEAFAHTEVEKQVVLNNEFGTKVRVLQDGPLAVAKYLFYVPTARPEDENNWLLDLLLAGYEFKADQTSLNLQEVGLSQDYQDLISRHQGFFRHARQKENFRELLQPEDSELEMRLKMMAVLTGCQAEVGAMLLEFLKRAEGNVVLDPVQELFDQADLTDFFWDEVRRRLGYKSEAPCVRDFAVALFRGENPLEPTISNPPALKAFFEQWKDSVQHGQIFQRWSKLMSDELQVEASLNKLTSALRLGTCDAFEAFEKCIIHQLVQQVEANQPAEGILQTIQTRRASHWYAIHEHAYQAITHAVEMAECMAGAELSMPTLTLGVERYLGYGWRVDQAYRRSCFHLRQYGHTGVMEGLQNRVTKQYLTNFLLPLNDAWSDLVLPLESWKISGIDPQQEFYQTRVLPYLEKGQKLFVIISDALRYEAAMQLADRIQRENRFTASMECMLGSLPSYTQLGMANLLPGVNRSIEPDSSALTVTLDGLSSTGTEARGKILHLQTGGKGVVLQAEAFRAMNSKTEGRAMMKENQVIYILHNVIDKTGDSASTESRTLEAVELAIQELVDILKKVAAINGSNALITADHGFLFQVDPVHEEDAQPLPVADEWKAKSRRYALGRGVQEAIGVKQFQAGQLGMDGDWTCAFPLSLGRFPLQGAGKRYVHGGFSLQEVLIPVIRVNKSRANDTGRVPVDMISPPSRITTGQFAISLYQEQATTQKLHPRTLKLGVYAEDGTCLSEEKQFCFDSKDPEARRRETRVQLVLSSKADDYNNKQVEIRLSELLPGTSQLVIYKTSPVKIQKTFQTDFDEY